MGKLIAFHCTANPGAATVFANFRARIYLGRVTVNQDQNHNQNPDGLLVECTYVAEGSDVEFTIDPVDSGIPGTFMLLAIGWNHQTAMRVKYWWTHSGN